MSARSFDVLVVGGGLHGLSAALHLARDGAKVALAERRWAGRHASGATAAGVRSLNRHPAEIALTREAIGLWHDMAAIVGDDCGFHASGQVRLGTKADLPEMERRISLVRAAGWQHEELIEAEQLRRLVPGLADDYHYALYVSDDGSADPHRAVQAFRRSAIDAGVRLFEGADVAQVTRLGQGWSVQVGDERLTAGVLVNAAGAWSAEFAARTDGPSFAIRAAALMMMVTERMQQIALPVCGVMGRKLSLKQTDCGTVVIGGALEGSTNLAAEVSQVRMHELRISARNAIAAFPALKNVVVNRCWTGIEAMMPDGLPVIGISKQHRDVIHCFGFSAHGFALVPAVGRAVADIYRGREPRTDLSAFSPDRPAVRA